MVSHSTANTSRDTSFRMLCLDCSNHFYACITEYLQQFYWKINFVRDSFGRRSVFNKEIIDTVCFVA